MDEAIASARAACESVTVGDPKGNVAMGPVVSKAQFNSIQEYIHTGMAEGATLVAGGPGRPEGLTKGFYVKPTVFANVNNTMTIAREEIFGPVLAVSKARDFDHALELANATEYGLTGAVYSNNREKIEKAREHYEGLLDQCRKLAPFLRREIGERTRRFHRRRQPAAAWQSGLHPARLAGQDHHRCAGHHEHGEPPSERALGHPPRQRRAGR
mgnify:CR=1 FL=1